MHTNMSISDGKTNLFWDEKGPEKLSEFGWQYIDRILTHGLDLCLIMNPSVNAYRRLDPRYEAPNQLKASATDRGAMVRVPIGNSKSMRVEVRAVAPDANPYLVLYSLFKTGVDGTPPLSTICDRPSAICRTTFTTRLRTSAAPEWVSEILGDDVKGRFRGPEAGLSRPMRPTARHLRQGTRGSVSHEVYNQALWNTF